MTLIYLVTGSVLWLLGLHALLLQRHVLRQVIAVNVMGSGVFMLLVALATRTGEPDPLLHALVVTGLVVAVSATAFALRLALGVMQARHRFEQSVNRTADADQSDETSESGS